MNIKGRPEGEIPGPTKLVKITEDLRKYATQQGIGENEALEHGLKEKSAEFHEEGGRLYANV